ncbi:UNVERIFIED_CONTAM: hypothetical protein K2H54_064274 [Gekko kuhli]
MPAKQVLQKKGGRAKTAPKRVPPAISASEDEGGPSLQDLAAKIAALEQAKATKCKRDEVATPMASATPKRTRAAARKKELWGLYARLAQLHESDDDADDQQAHDNLQAQGKVMTRSSTAMGELTAPQGEGDPDKGQQGPVMAAAPQQPVGGGSRVTGGWTQPTPDVVAAGSHLGVRGPGFLMEWGPSGPSTCRGGDSIREREPATLLEWAPHSPAMDLPRVYMEHSLPLGDHLLQAKEAKIWRGEYVEMFTLLFRDVEVKASVRDDPRELEKIRHKQVDKNFDNWLSAYTIYMGVVFQAYPDQGSVLVKYQDVIHHAYKEYNGATWLCYDELFQARAALDLTLPWDWGIKSCGPNAWGQLGLLWAGLMGFTYLSLVRISSWLICRRV